MSWTHGHSRSKTVGPTPTYNSWKSMKSRCRNVSEPAFCYYGGRGIAYDPSWEDFNQFLMDMGERPEGTTLERLDSNGNYCKDNCIWADAYGQAKNRKMPCTNTSGIKGVTWHSRIGRWQAAGMRKGVRYNLYSGNSFEEACAARRLWESQGEGA